jgi:hypothetical protein
MTKNTKTTTPCAAETGLTVLFPVPNRQLLHKQTNSHKSLSQLTQHSQLSQLNTKLWFVFSDRHLFWDFCAGTVTVVVLKEDSLGCVVATARL